MMVTNGGRKGVQKKGAAGRRDMAWQGRVRIMSKVARAAHGRERVSNNAQARRGHERNGNRKTKSTVRQAACATRNAIATRAGDGR